VWHAFDPDVLALTVLGLLHGSFATDAWKTQDADFRPDEVVDNPAAEAAEDELLNFRDILELSARAKKRCRSHRE